MAFIRTFNETQIQKMIGGANTELFSRLKADVLNGEVFPAVRKNELYFYYKGGCLYKFSGGAFKRNPNFAKFSTDCVGLEPYERAKKETENKFTSVCGNEKERQLLDKLYSCTFSSSYGGDVVVLDIEVNLNGAIGGGKKCDMALLNTRTDEIMFVEGKVFSDRRVNVKIPFIPEVIAQVNTYTAAIAEQRQAIIEQYANHIQIVNLLFGTSYCPPKMLIEPAKLLVYRTPKQQNENGKHSLEKISVGLGANNVLWVEQNDSPTLDIIWQSMAL